MMEKLRCLENHSLSKAAGELKHLSFLPGAVTQKIKMAAGMSLTQIHPLIKSEINKISNTADGAPVSFFRIGGKKVKPSQLSNYRN